MKTYLNVPMEQREQVKTLGARFDMAKKQWYCPDGIDLMLFVKWLPPELATWQRLPNPRKRKLKGKTNATSRG